MTIDRARLQSLIRRERASYEAGHPLSARAAEAGGSLLGGVPMTWMAMWSGGFPLQLAGAQGNRLTDIDGHTYVDFCLGDTGAMAGHSPPATVAAVRRRIEELGGITTMLPTEDAAWVGDELARRFGLPQWSFALTATDANRWGVRVAPHLTRPPQNQVYNHS
jgi:glutamate-1-semialdehyde 2,1-aminomutase